MAFGFHKILRTADCRGVGKKIEINSLVKYFVKSMYIKVSWNSWFRVIFVLTSHLKEKIMHAMKTCTSLDNIAKKVTVFVPLPFQ